MKKQCLNGLWSYRIGKADWSTLMVPFSTLAVGHSECFRKFDRTEDLPRVALQFDGITYAAKVFLNGVPVGEMLPYCEYTFDVSDVVRDKDNELLVELEDLEPEFGPSDGWENYSGIIRNVWVVYRQESYIEDCFFHTKMLENYTAADYTVETKVCGSETGTLQITLSKDNTIVDQFCCDAGETSVSRRVECPKLWAPDHPELYQLQVAFLQEGETVDRYECPVGFREFSCDRHRFLLNGEPLFILGVCRHEMMGDSGHVVTPEAIEADLLRIKSCGCNYVRLVHYPHCKETLEIADRIGLLVSEEPGLWWSDTSRDAVSAGSLEVLRRTILRDRNHPSIGFWLSFNECQFTEAYLIRSAEVCRENDPTRLVSGANCMSVPDTLVNYNKCGFDFYTMHPYDSSFERARESVMVLNDKPLLFTEWGGFFVYEKPELLTEMSREMYRYYLYGDDNGALAGASFWFWSEIHEYNRGKPACVDGILKEALVDFEGNPTRIYDTFCKAWQEAKNVGPFETRLPQTMEPYEFTLCGEVKGTPMQCSASGNWQEILVRMRESAAKELYRTHLRKIEYGPVFAKEEFCKMPAIPVMLSDGGEIVFTGEKKTSRIELIGAVSVEKGYPLAGEWGEEAAEVSVEFADGETQTFPLRNGREFTTAHTTYRTSRINPVAQYAKPLARFSYEKNHENYLVNRLELSLSEEKQVCRVTITSRNRGYRLLFWGVTL